MLLILFYLHKNQNAFQSSFLLFSYINTKKNVEKYISKFCIHKLFLASDQVILNGEKGQLVYNVTSCAPIF